MECPVCDPETDGAGGGTRGSGRLRPTGYTERWARAMLGCPHFEGIGSVRLILSGIPKVPASVGRGKRFCGPLLRRTIMHVHGNDSAAWLHCAIDCELLREYDRRERPPVWFCAYWLPMHLPRDNGSDLRTLRHVLIRIVRVWKCLRTVRDPPDSSLFYPTTPASSPSSSEAEAIQASPDLEALVRGHSGMDVEDVDNVDNGALFPWEDRAIEAMMADLPSTPVAARKRQAMRCAFGVLRGELRTVPDDSFLPGSAKRALEIRGGHPIVTWFPTDLLGACVDYVVCGAPEGNTLVAELTARRREDVRETFGLSKRAALAADEKEDAYAALGMAIVREGAYVHDVEDCVTGATSSDIWLLYGEDQWNHFDDRRYQHTYTFSPRQMRENFDLRAELVAALRARGLRLHRDSRICRDYVLSGGDYDGPAVPGPSTRTALGKVVEMMLEMDFLLKSTSYTAMIGHLRNERSDDECDVGSVAVEDLYETAKHAAVHQHVVIDGLPVSDLPPRLRRLALEDAEEVRKAWEEARDAKEDAREAREARRWRAADTDSD